MSSILSQVLKNYKDEDYLLFSGSLDKKILQLNEIIEEINQIESDELLLDFFVDIQEDFERLSNEISSHYSILTVIKNSICSINDLFYNRNITRKLYTSNDIQNVNNFVDNVSTISIRHTINNIITNDDIAYSIIESIIINANNNSYSSLSHHMSCTLSNTISNINTITFNEFLISNGINPLDDDIMNLLYNTITPLLYVVPHTYHSIISDDILRLTTASLLKTKPYENTFDKINNYFEIFDKNIGFLLKYNRKTKEGILYFRYKNTFRVIDFLSSLLNIEKSSKLYKRLVELDKYNSDLLDQFITIEQNDLLDKETVIPIILNNGGEKFDYNFFVDFFPYTYLNVNGGFNSNSDIYFYFEGSNDMLLGRRIAIGYKRSNRREKIVRLNYYYDRIDNKFRKVENNQFLFNI